MTRQRRTGISVFGILMALAMLICIMPAAAPRASADGEVSGVVAPMQLTKVSDTVWEFNNLSIFEDPDDHNVYITYSDEHNGWQDIGFGFSEGTAWRSGAVMNATGTDVTITICLADILEICGVEDPTAVTYGKVEGYNDCTISNVLVAAFNNGDDDDDEDIEGNVPEIGQLFYIGDPINIEDLYVYDLVIDGKGEFLEDEPYRVDESGTVGFDSISGVYDPAGIEGWYGDVDINGVEWEYQRAWCIYVGGDEDDFIYFRPYDSDEESPEVPVGIIFVGGTGTEEDPLLFDLYYEEEEPAEPDVPEETFAPAVSAVKQPSGAAPALNASIKEAEKAYTWGAKAEDNTLTWEAAEGADSFVICARGYGEKTYKKIGTTTEKTFDLSVLKKGTYDIIVRHEKGGVMAKCRNSAYVTALVR
ncbi:MAG: hypothetical protein IKP75_03010 [Oscillospiraceae bacterium]|nr:hypothetical protein [Oscillospiraceae bacterium]